MSETNPVEPKNDLTPLTSYDPGYFGKLYERYEDLYWHIHGYLPSRAEVFARAYRWARRREARAALALIKGVKAPDGK